NVFLHLHPVKVSRQAMKITYTWCMGGISFFLFLLLTITGVFLMFYYIPDTNQAYQNINQLSTVVSFGHLTRNMHRWAAHLMVVSCLGIKSLSGPSLWAPILRRILQSSVIQCTRCW